MQSYVARRQFLQRCFLARQVSAGKLAKEFLKIGCNLQRDLKHGQKQRSCESSCCKLSFFTCEMSPLWNLSMLKKCTPLGLHGSFLKEHCNHNNQCHDDHLCTKIIPGAPRLYIGYSQIRLSTHIQLSTPIQLCTPTAISTPMLTSSCCSCRLAFFLGAVRSHAFSALQQPPWMP